MRNKEYLEQLPTEIQNSVPLFNAVEAIFEHFSSRVQSYIDDIETEVDNAITDYENEDDVDFSAIHSEISFLRRIVE